jgi:putative addiction module killer protein
MFGLAYTLPIRILKSEEFEDWFETQTLKTRDQIFSRLSRIESFGHFGSHKLLKGHLWELKFNNGNRIYYTFKIVEGTTIFLILGGNKNGQEKDINKASKAAEEIHAQENKNR